MAERRILVLGARGFIGSHFVPAAAEAGFSVVTASRSQGGGDLVADLLKPPTLERAIADSAPDVVVNLGAEASVAASWGGGDSAQAVNARGVGNLLRTLGEGAPAAHVVILSSAEVYGEVASDALPITEDQPLNPSTPYGRGKAAMEEIAADISRALSLEVAIIRSFNQFGPGQPVEYVAAGIARQIALAEAEGGGRAVVTLGNPEAARDFTDVRDGARALAGVCKVGLTGTFNLCSGVGIRIADLAGGFAKLARIPVEIELDRALGRPVDVQLVRGSAERLRAATGWEPRIPLARTLSDLLESQRRSVSSS